MVPFLKLTVVNDREGRDIPYTRSVFTVFIHLVFLLLDLQADRLSGGKSKSQSHRTSHRANPKRLQNEEVKERRGYRIHQKSKVKNGLMDKGRKERSFDVRKELLRMYTGITNSKID